MFCFSENDLDNRVAQNTPVIPKALRICFFYNLKLSYYNAVGDNSIPE